MFCNDFSLGCEAMDCMYVMASVWVVRPWTVCMCYVMASVWVVRPWTVCMCYGFSLGCEAMDCMYVLCNGFSLGCDTLGFLDCVWNDVIFSK